MTLMALLTYEKRKTNLKSLKKIIKKTAFSNKMNSNYKNARVQNHILPFFFS